ncbi:MAG: hypothetical protein JST09_06940 [Bacteroidetes bacterium]|nr:hypothetical protein [Bacteroidota bacterium]
MNRLAALFVLLSLLTTSCNNREEKTVKFVSADAVYFDYQVWGDDEKGMITVMLQYREGDADGKPVSLKPPSKAELDGRLLDTGSTKSSGAYYEYSTTIDSFAGKHSIVFTDKTGRQYEEKFEFKPFRFVAAWPEIISRQDIELELEGMNKKDYIRVIALDTVFRSRGINETDTVKNGKLIITKGQLKNLANGPIRLELYKEEEIPVKNGTSAGGYLLITYGLKRNFELTD